MPTTPRSSLFLIVTALLFLPKQYLFHFFGQIVSGIVLSMSSSLIIATVRLSSGSSVRTILYGMLYRTLIFIVIVRGVLTHPTHAKIYIKNANKYM